MCFTGLAHVKNYLQLIFTRYRLEEVLLRVNEQRNILHEIRKRKANWIGHILRRNCLLQQVIEGKIKGQIKWQEDEEEGVRSYWMTLRTGEDTVNWRRNRFGRGFGPVVWQITVDDDDIYIYIYMYMHFILSFKLVYFEWRGQKKPLWLSI